MIRALCTSATKNLAKLGFDSTSWHQTRFSSALLASSTTCTANSVTQREIASDTQVQNARTHNTQQNNSGFTLIELMITCVLISIIALVIAGFLTFWLGIFAKDSAQTDLLDSTESALDIINSNIRLSGSADGQNRWPDPNSPSGNYGWQSSSSVLVLAKAAEDKNGNIIFSDPNKYITEKDNEVYYVKNNTLYQRTLAGDSPDDVATTTCPEALANASCPADRVIATDVQSFGIRYYDASETEVNPSNARSVQLSLVLQKVSGGTPITANYSTRMVFRND